MHKRLALLLAPALVVAALSAACSQTQSATEPLTPKQSAPSVAGTWTWTYDGGAGGQAITHTYTLKQNGETLTGTFKDSFDETAADITGKIHDGQVSFTVARPFQDSTMNFTFTGKLNAPADTITGTASWTIQDQPSTADWVAKRGT
jgi:hypothetical protein